MSKYHNPFPEHSPNRKVGESTPVADFSSEFGKASESAKKSNPPIYSLLGPQNMNIIQEEETASEPANR